MNKQIINQYVHANMHEQANHTQSHLNALLWLLSSYIWCSAVLWNWCRTNLEYQVQPGDCSFVPVC